MSLEKAMKIVHVVGARPNFMKLAPVFGALRIAQMSRKRLFTPASTTM